MGSHETGALARSQCRLSCPQSKRIGSGSQRESRLRRRSVLGQLVEILADPLPRFGESLGDVVQFRSTPRFLFQVINRAAGVTQRQT